MKKISASFVLAVVSYSAAGQVLSTPTGTVGNNGTTDQVNVTGFTRLINPAGQTLAIERENEDSWLTFHDPNDFWYSMGIDRSNNGTFTINWGGTLTQSTSSFVMNASGLVGIGTSEPVERMHVNGTVGIGKFEAPNLQAGLKIEYTDGGSGTTVFKHQRWGSDFYFRRNSSSGERNQLFFGGSGDHYMDIYNGNNEVKVRFSTAGDSYFTGGKVGIATPTPKAFLDVGAFTNGGVLGSVLGRLQEGNASGEGTFLGVRGYGTQLANYNGKSFALEHSFYGVVNSSVNFYRGGGIGGGFLTLNTSENLERMRITGDGNVGIGTTDPGSFKLAVEGKVGAREVVVTTTNPWPDYVFEPNYNLPSLSELEQYIKTNKHLPEVPTANEVKENGLSLGEMNAILLKKVEELTLHLIEMKKENEMQQKQIDELKNRK